MALIVFLLLIGLIGAALVLQQMGSDAIRTARDKRTTEALSEAKAGLVGYAAKVSLMGGAARPGDLPCPDLDNDGEAELSCGNAAGSTGQDLRLGRLPWKTLGLPDLRDGHGERLWYAVSNNFKNNTRTTCSAPGQPGCLNSDSGGTITVRDRMGNITHNGGVTSSGAVAVILSPGVAVMREDAATVQDRSCVDCTSAGQCTTVPASSTARCNPSNYLEVALGEDNAVFADAGTNGFIQGEIQDGDNRVILNDRIAIVSNADIFPLLEKRVAGEVALCLKQYASNTATSRGLFPFAARLDVGNTVINFSDDDEDRFGRVPDTPFSKTEDKLDTAGGDVWTAECAISSAAGWWLNWKDIVFYGVADEYEPDDSAPSGCGSGSCLTVSPPSATANKRAVVIIAGRALPTQTRTGTGKNAITAYLELENSDNDDDFTQAKPTATFNDRLFYIQ